MSGTTEDDFEIVQDDAAEEFDDDIPTKKLEPGQELRGTIRHIEHNVGRYGNSVLHLSDADGDPFKYWSNTTIDRRLDKADVQPGDRVLIRKTERENTWTDEDGNEQTSHEFEVGVATR